MKTLIASPGSTTGLSAFANSLILSTLTPRNWETLFKLKSYMLNRLQNNSSLDIQIVETDFPSVREVDLKLIELGKQLEAVIDTNDFNLNKVSQLRGVSVLNINELANALKPVVLPGEAMRVFILKEGKEYNQGVAYLDDGTMVVVDNARRLIGKN